jgi:hypothetical protein
MSEEKSVSVIFSAMERGFTSFCEMLVEVAKYLCIFLCVVVPIGIIVGAMVISSSNSAFSKSESRLALQMDVIMGSNNGLSASEEVEIIKLLIQSYDVENDTINAVLNPNAKPIDLQSVLTHFKVDSEGVKVVSDPSPKIVKEKTELGAKEGW